MKVRFFTEDDYPIIKAWWEGHNLAAIPFKVLPGLGWIVSEGDKDIGAGYLDTSAFGVMCYFYGYLSNPEATPFQSDEGYDTVLAGMVDFATSENYSIMLAMPYQRSLKIKAKKNGFIVNHDSVAQMIKILRKKEVAA